MMALRAAAALLAAVVLAGMPAATAATRLRAGYDAEDGIGAPNPLRKVITMLQAMRDKTEEEAQTEKVIFDKYMCYCEHSKGNLETSVKDAEIKIPQLENDIMETNAQTQQLSEEIKNHNEDVKQTTDTIAQATAIRTQAATAWATEESETKASIAALSKAIPLIERGMTAELLQSPEVGVLRRLAKHDIGDGGLLASFLSQEASEDGSEDQPLGEGAAYEPKSGEVLGILKQLQESMGKNLAEGTAAEKKDKETYDGLMLTKHAELRGSNEAIQSKTARVGELGVTRASLSADHDDAKASLKDDQKFLRDLTMSCDAKEEEWGKRSTLRIDELKAIQETTKILSDEATSQVFSKTMVTAPESVSLFQVSAAPDMSPNARSQALKAVLSARGRGGSGHARLDFLTVALQGKKMNVDEVTKMIDEMVNILVQEQKADDEKKNFCETDARRNIQATKALTRQKDFLTATLADAKDNLKSVEAELKASKKGIKDLDQQASELTAQRKVENAEYVEFQATTAAAHKVLTIAEQRLNEFYTSSEYSEVTTQPAASDNPLAFVQTRARAREAPPPPPADAASFGKYGGEGKGVLGLIAKLKANLDQEAHEAELEERKAQDDYKTFLKDAAEKRSAEGKVMLTKVQTRAELEAQIGGNEEKHDAAAADLKAGTIYLKQLAKGCDPLLEKYEQVKEGRLQEAFDLNTARAILLGAKSQDIQDVTRARFAEAVAAKAARNAL